METNIYSWNSGVYLSADPSCNYMDRLSTIETMSNSARVVDKENKIQSGI